MFVMLGWIYQVKLLTELLDRYPDDQLASTCLALWKFIFLFHYSKGASSAINLWEIKMYLQHTHKNWLTRCKNCVKFWLSFQSILTQRAFQSKFHPTFTGRKLIAFVLSQLLALSTRNDWNFAFWVPIDWTQKLIINFCVFSKNWWKWYNNNRRE